MSENLLVNDFKFVEDIFEFNEDLIKNYNEDEVYIQNPENLYNLHNNLPLLPERLKI